MKHRFTVLTIVILTILLLSLLSTPTLAQEIGWQADFSKPESLAHSLTVYDNSLSKKPADAVTVKELADGVLKFGLKFDPERRSDRWTLYWGEMIWWPDAGAWTPVDLTKYPIIEMKWRGGRFDAVFHSFLTKGGEKRVDYVNVAVTSEVTDPDGSKWNVCTARIAPDSSNPTLATPVKLLGISMSYTSPDKADAISEVKYLRVRGFNAEEAAAEVKVKESLANFPKKRWRGFDNWFPYGVYTVGMQRIFETWQGDYAGAFQQYSNRHINFIAYNDEITIGRLGGTKSEEGFQAYIKAQNEQNAAAKAAGLRISLGLLSDLMYGKSIADGYQQYLPAAKKLVAAFPNDDTIVAWGLNDELAAESLIPHAQLMRALRESDPLGRPELVAFNNPGSYRSFTDYLSVAMWDCYPILNGEGKRNPWFVRDQAREYRSADPSKPMWVILPSFETRRPAADGTYARPSDAEMKLMAYIALAEGAKGIIWYNGWEPSGSLEGLVNRAGSVRGGMFDTISDLGQKLIPIGKLLIPTVPVDIPAFRIDTKSKEHGLTVTVLRDKKLGVDYLIVINEDLTQTRSATITLPKELQAKGKGPRDLSAHLSNPYKDTPTTVGDTLKVVPLSPGDARVYLISSATQFDKISDSLLVDFEVERLRSLLPDITLANNWKLPIGEIGQVGWPLPAVGKRDWSECASLVDVGADRLYSEMLCDSEFTSARKALSDICNELSEVSRLAEVRVVDAAWWTGNKQPNMVPNMTYPEQSKRYWEVGRGYARLYTAFLNGDRKTLSTELPKLRQDCLKMRLDLITASTNRLRPAE